MNLSVFRFARSTVSYLRRHGFNGLDVDWEYPAGRGSPPHDKVKFSLLIQVIKLSPCNCKFMISIISVNLVRIAARAH